MRNYTFSLLYLTQGEYRTAGVFGVSWPYWDSMPPYKAGIWTRKFERGTIWRATS